MSKTLGQVAEAAYEEAGVVDPAIAWEAAAQAAGTEAIRQWVRGQFETVQLREAVIKAARRYIWANEAGVLQGELLDLRDTIEALDKAEDEP